MDKIIRNLIIVVCIIFIALFVVLFFLVNFNVGNNLDNPSMNESVDCSTDIYNCEDFTNCEEARVVFDKCMNFTSSDIHGLDLDKDGIACNSLCE